MRAVPVSPEDRARPADEDARTMRPVRHKDRRTDQARAAEGAAGAKGGVAAAAEAVAAAHHAAAAVAEAVAADRGGAGGSKGRSTKRGEGGEGEDGLAVQHGSLLWGCERSALVPRSSNPPRKRFIRLKNLPRA